MSVTSGPRERPGGWAGRIRGASGWGRRGNWRAAIVLAAALHSATEAARARGAEVGTEVGTEAGTEAEDRTVARRMADEAAQRYEAGDYDGARDLFRRAYAVYPAPTLALWEARALDRLGRLVEAEERYAAVLRYTIRPGDPDIFRDAASEARQEIGRLRERIPTVAIQLKGQEAERPGIEVEIDGRRIKPAVLGYPVPVDPGMRTIVVRVNRVERFRETITAEERGRRSVDVWLSTPTANLAGTPGGVVLPTGPHDADGGASGPGNSANGSLDVQRVLGWVALGVGGVGFAGGLVAGQAASSKHETLDEECPDGSCAPPYHDDLDAFRRFRTLSTIGYVAGTVGVAAGVTLLLTAPDTAQPNASGVDGAAVRFGLGNAELRLSF